MLVITPIGISTGAITVLLTVSHINKNIAPTTAENGINTLLLFPTNFLVMCGIMSPTKPITPQQLTIHAVIKELNKNMYLTASDVFIPKDDAFSLPKLIIFITLPKHHKIITPTNIENVTTGNNLSSKKARLPISHINAE